MKYTIFSLLVSIALSATTVLSEETVTIVMQEEYPIGKKILQAISKKMGVTIEIMYRPNKRSTALLRNSLIHAEFARINSYQNIVGTAIKVAEPLISAPINVYSTNTTLKFTDWESLKKYSIVTIRGRTLVSEKLGKYKTTEVSSSEEAFRMLSVNRVQIHVTLIYSANLVLSANKYDYSQVVKHEPPIDSITYHTFFSSKYPKLARRYLEALVAIKKEGVFDKIVSETFSELD